VVQDALVKVSSDRLEALYREQAPRLWRALLAYAGDGEVASDALAETFAQAIARGDAIEQPEVWVWRVAFRIAAGELKDRRRHLPPGVDRGYEMPEPVPELITALGQISPNQRLAVVLHDYADRPTHEIAEILGSTRATVHVHLSNGRRRLRTLLEDDDG
jgi:DNA-directed RNA polymerase specialized sigma24 family protein